MSEYSFGDLLEMRTNAAAAQDGETVEYLDALIQQAGNIGEYQPSVTGPLQAAAIGAGSAFNRLGAGIQNIYAGLTGDEQTQQRLATEQAEARRLEQPAMEQYPISTTVGQVAPALATMPLSGGLPTQMALGGLMGAAEYDENQGTQGLLGAGTTALGTGAMRGIQQIATRGGRVLRAAAGSGDTGSGVTSRLGDEGQRLATRADELGMQLSPGQLQDDIPLQQLEASIKSNPAFSAVPSRIRENNQQVINRLAAESIGQSGEEITPRMLAKAADEVGDVYDSIGERLGDDLVEMTGLRNIRNELATDALPYLDRYESLFPRLADGELSGTEFVKLKNLVEKDIRAAWKGGGGAAEELQEFGGRMMDSLEDALPGMRDELREAGLKWRNLKALESGKVVTKGNVNARSLDSQLRRLDKGGYLRGRNESDYYDAVRTANYFSDVVGDSGTATRSYMGLLMSDPTALATTMALRPAVRSYYQSGGPLAAAALGVVPQSPMVRQAGATAARSYGLLGD